MDILVPPSNRVYRLCWNGQAVQCAVGRAGLVPAALKREGDGATPAGDWPLRRVLYRPDRLAPPVTALPVAPLAPEDGWCDDPDHPAYNQPIKRPFSARHEALWRADDVYDVIVVLGYNDSPSHPGTGSAIFLHCVPSVYPPTAGCVALVRSDLLRLLADCGPGDRLCLYTQENHASIQPSSGVFP